jgi:signal transduction histidine kinase
MRRQDRLLAANEPVQAFLQDRSQAGDTPDASAVRRLREYLGDLFLQYGEYYDEILLADAQGVPVMRQDRFAGSHVRGESAPELPVAPPSRDPGAGVAGPRGLPTLTGVVSGRPAGFGETDRAAFRDGPLLAAGTVRLRVEPAETGRGATVSVLMPVESSRRPNPRIGYVLARIRPDYLWPEEWTTRRFGERGQLAIVDTETGDILYHTRREWIGRRLNHVDPALNQRLMDPRLAASGDSAWISLGGADGRRVATLLGLPGVPWRIIATAVPGEFVSEARRAALWNLLVAALVLLAAAGVLVFTSGRLSRSIQTLTAGAQRIAGGDLAGPPIRVETHDEIHTLADAFNQMSAAVRRNIEMREQVAAELDALNRSLESRVQERTRELETLNTALNRANAELKELDRLKSNFLATVSHEFKTPLTSIKAFAEILHDELEERNVSAELRRFLRIIDAESDRLSRLIKNVLDLSRLESGRVVWRMADFPAAEIVETTIDGLLPVLQEKRIRLERDLHCGDVRLHGDPDRVQEVLANVIENAIQASAEGQRIVVGCRPADTGNGAPRMLRLFVRDEGRGIPADELEKVFDRFHQVGAHGRRPGGTGLGLAICREITEHHGGRIWAESTPGYGSTFHITLPLAAAPAPAGDPPGAPARSEGTAPEDAPHA